MTPPPHQCVAAYDHSFVIVTPLADRLRPKLPIAPLLLRSSGAV